MNNSDIKEVSKALNVLKNASSQFTYNEICKLNDTELAKYKELLKELEDLNIRADSKENGLRGKKLEELVAYLLKVSGNIFKIEKNVHTNTNEVDQVIKLSETGKMLSSVGIINEKLTCFLGECKNYKKTLSVTYVGKFCSLLQTTNIKLGIIFSFCGISGSGWKNGHGLVRKFYMSKEKENERFCIIDFSHDDFISISKGNNFLQIIDDKLEELRIDTSYEHLISKHLAEDEILDSC